MTKWPSDWVTEWQEASQTIDRMVYLKDTMHIHSHIPGKCFVITGTKNNLHDDNPFQDKRTKLSNYSIAKICKIVVSVYM